MGSVTEAISIHLEDSLALLPVLDTLLPSAYHTVAEGPATVIDVGSGGGLPGVILAIARPTWQASLLQPSLSLIVSLQQDAYLVNDLSSSWQA